MNHINLLSEQCHNAMYLPPHYETLHRNTLCISVALEPPTAWDVVVIWALLCVYSMSAHSSPQTDHKGIYLYKLNMVRNWGNELAQIFHCHDLCKQVSYALKLRSISAAVNVTFTRYFTTIFAHFRGIDDKLNYHRVAKTLL
jgi:hypothetical protein